MEHKGAALVDRPTWIAAGETLSGGMRVLLTPAGERFRKMRKALHAHLSPSVVQTYGSVLMSNAHTHILDILDSPEIHQEHAKRYAASVVMALAYGEKAGGHDDPDVQAVNRCFNRLGVDLRLGLSKVDVFPLLRYVPGYLDKLCEGHCQELVLFKKYLGIVREQMVRLTNATISLFRIVPPLPASSPSQIPRPPTSPVPSLAQAPTACYPDAARKVQDEIDRVTDSE
ncbi:hypothetical protein C0995_000448 [Termitomyces sp. Mi166|nr:hypothetical protein C0995_000448 [Termitomyces sp. Mi166\